MTLASLFLCAAGQDRNRNPNPALLHLELSARRNSRQMIEIDGKVINAGEQRLKNIVLVYHFVAPDGKVVSTRKGALEVPVLDPGGEAEVMLETPDVARAVEIRVGAERGGTQLDVKKGAVVPIE